MSDPSWWFDRRRRGGGGKPSTLPAEVYRARDTRLDRTVAVKVLPSHLSDNVAMRQRFEREARAVAGLNHPHICTLHDIGCENGVDFLVMEYLEGESLADRLNKGALPLEEALRYGIQIADAMEKAHREGVVHRDLKPGNVMLIESGAKLLDFGLAKFLDQRVDRELSQLSALPTEEKPLTEQGAVLGTFQYMSPEQLEGKEADTRTDVFAFGALLYEMVTGARAFEGKSRASLIAAILEREPRPMTELRPVAPASLEWLVRGCLTKDPEERWQTAHDVKLQLERTAEGRADIETKAEVRRRSPGLLGAIVVLTVTSLLLAVFALIRAEPEDLESIRFAVRPPEGTSIALGPAAPQVAVSPDGRQLVFATGGSGFIFTGASGESGLWIRSLDALEARKLSGTDGATIPFWSPDGRFVGFFARGMLYKIELAGGAPQSLCEAPLISHGGAWNRDGVILFGTLEGIARVSASGGETSLVTTIDHSREENRHVWPQFLPDGRHFLYLAMGSDDEHNGIHVGSLDSSETRFVLEAEVFARYTAPGYLVFLREAMLMAQAFDASSFELTGEPHRIASGVGYNPGLGRTTFSVSDAGVLAYRVGGVGGQPDSELTWFDRQGKRLGTVGPPGKIGNIALSPDETRVAVERVDEAGNRDVWLIEISSGAFSRFTFGATSNEAPLWSSDGTRVLFTSESDIYAKPASGAGREELIVESDELKHATSMSPNGDYAVYMSQS